MDKVLRHETDVGVLLLNLLSVLLGQIWILPQVSRCKRLVLDAGDLESSLVEALHRYLCRRNWLHLNSRVHCIACEELTFSKRSLVVRLHGT